MKSYGLKELAEHYFATKSEVTDYVAASDYEKLKADYDLILAELQKANGIIIDLQHNPPKLAKEFLTEIKAEAGRAGFIEGVRQMCDNEIGMLGHDAESCANHYAARVRLGFEPGTWLKDSNVNGGKRQGGEK